MIRRRGQELKEESSSDEEDAFAALSHKNSAKRSRVERNDAYFPDDAKNREPENVIVGAEGNIEKPSALPSAKVSSDVLTTSKLPTAVTSSMKRHHKPSDSRKAKMDALLLELEEEKGKQSNRAPRQFVPDKKGSFVGPGEEKLTSNLFVGNLAPSVTEEDLSSLFSQFGSLYSIKIMWPRTTEERQRGRNTGFVCFVNREDAEEALESCNDTDPFNVGRLLTMGWGKNVKKIVTRDPGGFTESNYQSQPGKQNESKKELDGSITQHSQSGSKDRPVVRPYGLPHFITLENQLQDRSLPETYEARLHSTGAIRVEAPTDPDRFHFISTIASYVATDGMAVERRLCTEEEGNALFNFLTLENADERQRKEYLFYRWRVYAFSQGDTYSFWRTEPFVMFHPNGRYWIPPPMDKKAAIREKAIMRERQKQEAQVRNKARKMATGRQIERARLLRRRGRGQSRENPSILDSRGLDEFNRLVYRELTVSREKICRAMAFCFDNCLAARHISGLLRDALLDDSVAVDTEMRIARLFLLSDILFNSQQPGIRNAFMYRTTIESMAPEIFSGLGKYRERNIGRMTINKLRKAVSTVLGAWTDWGVYNAAFMDDLEALFEGKELGRDITDVLSNAKENKSAYAMSSEAGDEGEKSMRVPELNDGSITKEENFTVIRSNLGRDTSSHLRNCPTHLGHNMPSQQDGLDGESIGSDAEDLDGEDLDGAEIVDEEYNDEEYAADHGSSYALDENDLDGEPLKDDAIEEARK